MINWLDLMSIGEDLGNKEPMYVRLMNRFAEAISTGSLPDGTKLPTNRELSQLLKIDRSTVSRAYAELVAKGLIESWVGRGTFVKARPDSPTVRLANSAGSSFDWREKFSRSSELIAELLEKQPTSETRPSDFVSFSAGSPGLDSFPQDDLKSILEELAASSRAREMFDYSPAEGNHRLRKTVLEHLAKQGIAAKESELLIVSGSQQGIDLAASLLVDAGDSVVIEQPTYFWAICNFRARQARLHAVPTDEHGIIPGALAAACSRFKPKLIYLMPDFQNPTGRCLSLNRRRDLLRIAEEHGVPILEDNYASELRYQGEQLPSLRSLTGGDQIVINQGTFSKALCPGLRIGWLVAPEEVIERIKIAKRTSDLSTNSIAQVVLASYLEDGLYDEHLERVKALYKRRRDLLLAAMDKHLKRLKAVTWSEPEGGLFIWAKLADGLSARELLRLAERAGVSFSPGDLFFTSEDDTPYLRLCFIQIEDERIEIGIERLSQAIKELLKRSFGNQSGAQKNESVLV